MRIYRTLTQEMLEVIANGTAVAWQQINMMGEYDFSKLTDSGDSRFDIEKILAWRFKPAA